MWESLLGGAASGGGIPWEGISYGAGNSTSPMQHLLGNPFDEQRERQYKETQRTQAMLLQEQLQFERASFQQRMKMAKEQGLHPLAMLGVPMSAPSLGANVSAPESGSFSADFKKSGPEPNAQQQKDLDSQSRFLEAQARREEALAGQEELQFERSKALLLGQAGRPAGAVTSADKQVERQSFLSKVPRAAIRYGGSKDFAGSGDSSLISIKPDEVTASSPSNPGVTAGVGPLMKRVIDSEGKETMVVDQNALQVEVDDGAFFQSLVNHGVSVGTAMDIVGLKDVVLTGLAGVAGVGGLAWKWHKARQASEIARKAKAHRRWKGGD